MTVQFWILVKLRILNLAHIVPVYAHFLLRKERLSEFTCKKVCEIVKSVKIKKGTPIDLFVADTLIHGEVQFTQ